MRIMILQLSGTTNFLRNKKTCLQNLSTEKNERQKILAFGDRITNL